MSQQASLENLPDLPIENICQQLAENGDYKTLSDLVRTSSRIQKLCQKYLDRMLAHSIMPNTKPPPRGTGWNLYFKENLGKIRSQGMHSREALQHVAAMWKSLSPAEKAEWIRKSQGLHIQSEVIHNIRRLAESFSDHALLTENINSMSDLELQQICEYLTHYKYRGVIRRLMLESDRFREICEKRS
jgi:hypothetical protein